LQIVEEQRKRMFRACEYADKAPEHALEAGLARPVAEASGTGGCSPMMSLQFGDQVHNEQSRSA